MSVKSAEELEEIMGRYGFKEPEPVVDNRKYKVSFQGKETILTSSELSKLEVELGPSFRLLIKPVEDDSDKDADWKELIRVVKHAWEYGIHSNDMTLGEIEEDISVALDKFAQSRGLPKIDWEYHEYEPLDDLLDLYDQEQHRVAAEARGCI